MSHKTNLKTIAFDGKFNAEIRKKIQIKRLQLGLAYQRAASLFNANWSTLRKWEMGPTTTCSLALRQKLEDFLNGKFDQEVAGQQSDLLTGCYLPSLPDSVHQIMENFGTAYRLLKYRPDLREALIQDLDKVTRKSLHRLISSEKPSSIQTGNEPERTESPVADLSEITIGPAARLR